MEQATGCHIVYVHQDVREARLICANGANDHLFPNGTPPEPESVELAQMLVPLLEAFGHVHICPSGSSCMAKVFQLQESSPIDLRPTIVLIDTPFDERPRRRSRSLSPRSSCPSRSRSRSSRPDLAETEIRTPDVDMYGLQLLQRIISEAQLRNLSKLVIPVPIISNRPAANHPDSDDDGDENAHNDENATAAAMNARKGTDATKGLPQHADYRRMIRRCLELGAADVIVSPLSDKSIASLEICVFRARREAMREQQSLLELRRGRQRSWVGVNEGKPYAYLREAMVSGLMKHICREGDGDERIDNVRIAVSSERRAVIGAAVGQWAFSAHEFSDDELVVAAVIMFQHALDMVELEKWRIPTDQLINFLVACRAAYNSFVPYHNFRHVVDVLQATFHFLVKIGTLPPYADHSEPERPAPEPSPIASLLGPFEALTLLITAIGHDVGHPGVNNGFLVTLNAPLAQLYNDRSVLESFHCAAYSQILRRYWPSAFQDAKMRNLMISSILATDMGLHFDYMKKLESTQCRLEADRSTDGWNGRMLEEQKVLACSLLIKCADISNVSRKIDTALKWMYILADEFARQASMELELEIQSSLMAEPKKDIMSLAKAQLGFMNLFAIPLFEGVADIMPAMKYTVSQLEANKTIFEHKIREEQAGLDPARRRLATLATPSPRTMTFDVPEDKATAAAATAATPATAATAETATAAQRQERPANGADDGDPLVERDKPEGVKQQRRSETTDGSNSGPYSGEWDSQATSATTGKMPLSPSTQNTSLASRDSLDQQLLGPPPFGTADSDNYNLQRAAMPGSRGDDDSGAGTPSPLFPPAGADDESNTGGSAGRAEGVRLLRKKSSRFLRNAFPFFKRNKGSSPPLPAADAATTAG